MEFYRLKLFILILFFVLCGCQNPLGDTKGSNLDTQFQPGLPATPLAPNVETPFNFDFDFTTASDYDADDGAEVTAGVGQLIRRDVVDDSSDGSGVDLNFSHRESANVNLTIAANKVTMTAGTTATLVSRVIDHRLQTPAWSKFSFATSYPFGKEIAVAAETGYGNAVGNFSNGLVGLWHLNQPAGTVMASSAIDSSASGNHGSPGGGTVFGITAPLVTGARFDGVDDNILIGSTNIPVAGAARTTAAWIRKDVGSGNIVVLAYGNNSTGALWEMMVYNGELILHAYDGGFDTVGIAAPITEGVWNHVAITYVGTTVTIYSNGVNRGTKTLGLNTGSAFFRIGGPGYFGQWKGDIDEVGIWSRGLSDAEIEQLYRRGANRIKFQVRGCTDATCSTAPTWTGPSGTNADFFTELNNATTTPFSTNWSVFAGLNATFDAWVTANMIKPFMQYKAIFESDSASWFPDLISAGFSPTTVYVTTDATIKNKTAIAPTFKTILSLAITEGGTCAGVRYDIGNTTSNFLYWSGTAWTASANYATAQTKASLESLTEANWKLFPIGSGTFFVRVHLPSNGLQTCTIDKISVHGSR